MTSIAAPVTDSVLRTIGRTPVVQLKRIAPAGGADVFVKLEYFNPTGSYKDRMALAMIEGAEARGTLRPGMRVIEYTGGSTGSSLAMVCAVKGYAFAPLSSDAFAREKIQTMQALGADVELLEQLGAIDAFCGAVGTAGMLVGVGRALKAGGSKARIVALEPSGSPVL